MSEETPSPAPVAPAPAAPAPEKKGKSSLLTRLVVLSFMLAVIGGECLVACLYLPSVSASAPAADAHAPEDAAHEEEPQTPHALKREVDLGKYSITSFQPASNTTLLIDFHLFGTVAADDGASSDGGHGGHGGGAHGEKAPAVDDEFTRQFEKNKHRMRDQVITIVRSAEITDFADPSLGLIRRKILEKSNRTLGKPLLEEVIFSDFSLVEQ
jgi:flagellar basal body-associated protein FliL